MAVRALKRVEHPRAVTALSVAATTDADTKVREASLRALARISGEEAMPVLVDQLQHGTRPVRRTASSLISDFEPSLTETYLTEALGDPDWYVRYMAAAGLGKSTERRVRMPLVELRRRERNPLVRLMLWRATRGFRRSKN